MVEGRLGIPVYFLGGKTEVRSHTEPSVKKTVYYQSEKG